MPTPDLANVFFSRVMFMQKFWLQILPGRIAQALDQQHILMRDLGKAFAQVGRQFPPDQKPAHFLQDTLMAQPREACGHDGMCPEGGEMTSSCR